MGISGISSYANLFYSIDPAYERSRRDDENKTTGNGGRNTGPDTARISDAALEKYQSMKNASKAAGSAEDQDTEKEIADAIAKAQQEASDLTATYERILSGEGSEEEKTRLSQPIYKRLKDKLEELAGLKAQAQGLANAKFTAMKSA